MMSEEAKIKETVEILAGSRQHKKLNKAAVRMEDIADITGIPLKLQASKLEGDTVTVEDYNKMVADNQILHKVLLGVAKRVQARMI